MFFPGIAYTKQSIRVYQKWKCSCIEISKTPSYIYFESNKLAIRKQTSE